MQIVAERAAATAGAQIAQATAEARATEQARQATVAAETAAVRHRQAQRSYDPWGRLFCRLCAPGMSGLETQNPLHVNGQCLA
jgi:hypothetical protein